MLEIRFNSQKACNNAIKTKQKSSSACLFVCEHEEETDRVKSEGINQLLLNQSGFLGRLSMRLEECPAGEERRIN